MEKLACGGAVLASTAGSLVEVLQHQAHLTAADDEAGWVAAMQRVLTEPDFAARLRDGSEAFAARYSWAECSKQTWDVYRRVAAGVVTTLRA